MSSDQAYYTRRYVRYAEKNALAAILSIYRSSQTNAPVASLPEDYIIVTYGGDPFYRVENTLYRPFVVDGAPYFEVLGQFPY